MSHSSIEFALLTASNSEPRSCPLNRAIIAGWTGRDKAAMEAHIAELGELGIARPARTPMFYRVACARVSTASEIEAIGSASSGEVEFFLLNVDGEIWLGAGSDHTDREAEAAGVTLSKQMCDKPVARELWRLEDVAGHWDQLQLRAHAMIDGERLLYQEGPVTAMLAPEDLLSQFASEDRERGGFSPGDLMMCGTLPAIGGVRAGSRFEFELNDPNLGRSIKHGYDVIELPVEG